MPRANPTGVQGLIKRVEEDGSIRWELVLRWRGKDGRYHRHHERFPVGITPTAAKHRARLQLNKAMNGQVLRADAERTLAPLLEEYVGWRAANGRRAVASSRRQARALVASLGDVPLACLSPFALERYKAGRQASGAGHPTINRSLTMWRAFLRKAATWGWLSRDLAEALRDVKPLVESQGRVRYLTAEEEHRLMGALANKPHLRRLVVTALLTGARQGELLGLRPEDVDLGAGELVLERTKNGKRRRIPIAEALAPVLREALACGRREAVFIAEKGRTFTKAGLESAWNKVRKRAGLEDFHFHDLRHSHATLLRRRGVALDVIQQVLGHSTLAMTQRYSHIGADEVRAALRDLPAPGFRGLTPGSCQAPSLALVK